MSASPTSGLRRHSSSHPCRVCGGHDRVRRGTGERCFGFLSGDGLYEHCTREDFAGDLIPGKDGCYAHRLNGDCKCGKVHGPALAQLPPPKGGGRGQGKPGRRLGPEVARWDYRTAEGVVIFQVRRHQDGESKTFVQYRPTPGGGWAPGRGDAPLVPYRLPELLAAPPEAPVYVPEGEKCVELLRTLGQVATCNPGGAEKWRDEFAPHLAGRHVVVLRDNDPVHPKLGYRVGWKHAEDVARSVAPHAASVKVLDLAEGCKLLGLDDLPEKGDVVDFVTLGGSVDDLEWLAGRAPDWSAGEAGDEAGPAPEAVEWDEPALFQADAAMPFPVHVFPSPLAELVTTGAQCFPCPVDLLAVPALAVASAAIGRTVALRIKRGWEESASLYLAMVAETGMTKTPALKLITQPIWQIHHDLIGEYEAELAAYEALKAAYEAKKGKPGGPPPRKPFPTRFVLDNSTVEAMAPILANNPRGLFQLKDELSGLFGAMGQYKNGKGDDQQFYLCLHSGVTVAIDRKSMEGVPILVRDPFLTLFGGIQPKVLAGIDALDKEDGLCERFLFSRPDWVKVRMTWEAAPDHLRDDWCAAVRRIWDRKQVRDDDGRERPFVVGLTDEAARLFETFYNANEEEAESADFPPQLKGAWPKFRAACARLALVLEQLHWAYDPTAGMTPWPVGSRAMAGAIELVGYFKAHLRRARGITRAPETRPAQDGRAVLKWAVDAGRSEFKLKEARDNFRRRFAPDGPELNEALAWLEARHCIRRVEPKPQEGAGRKPSPRYLVNPDLLAEAPAEYAKLPAGSAAATATPDPE